MAEHQNTIPKLHLIVIVAHFFDLGVMFGYALLQPFDESFLNSGLVDGPEGRAPVVDRLDFLEPEQPGRLIHG